jgi:hypothetical protein
MYRASRRPLAVLGAAVLVLLSVPSSVHAQRATQQVLDLNRQAMEAYANLEIDQATSLLDQALQVAQRGRVTGAALARTYVNRGVVAIGGMADNAAGLASFVQALEADPNVQLDPLTSTPEIQTTFALARNRAGVGRAGAGGGGGGDGGGGRTDPEPSDPSGGSGNLTHTPVPEQLVQTALPVYLEVPGSPARVYLYYRGHGMREYSRVEMERISDGWGYEIPCTDVFEPEVSYYLVAFGDDGSPIGFSGSQTQPITVPVVAIRTTEAPSLPGRAPPVQCGEHECPPGMPCSGGGGQMGDSCSTDADCASRNCVDDLCAMSAEIGGGGGGDDQGAPRFFFRAGAGLGMSYVSPGLPADRFPCAPDDIACLDYGDSQEVTGWVPMDVVAARQNGYEPASLSNNANGEETRCGLTDAEGFGDEDHYCLYVRDAGMVANLQVRLEVGYYVLPWLGFSAFARFQPFSGIGPLSFMLIGARVHARVFDEGRDSGPSLSVHVGGSGGQIQVAVPNNGATPPYGQSGPGGFHFGANASWRFTRNVGIFVNPDFMFQVPNFVFNLDLTLGIEVGF